MPVDRRSSKRQKEQTLNPQTLHRKSVEATEDYLETINALIDEKGFAASVDIAERMNVSKPTVTSIVKKLHNQGFLIHEKYRGLKLTQKGKKLAEEMQKKHELITSFLMLFGVEEKVAKQDAELIEHGLHVDTLKKLQAFTEFVLSNPELIRKYREVFRQQQD
ncbi:MAG: metal-dependent transcriptional regulator [Rhabdochlamydiaceae bacterium]